MRLAWISGTDALKQRMVKKFQVVETEPEAAMPPYMESFLAHLRVLVGVPFEYLIPDPRLLPDESIRFFYLDRSWTDRLVDGAVGVGKIGTREQAHHQAHAPAVSQQLDLTERLVRSLQRGLASFLDLKEQNKGDTQQADTITGFLLRSSAVVGWPHMDVRAYRTDISEPLNPADDSVFAQQLKPLRIELLSPSVMIALFQGTPQLVFLEEPHHGVQFGVREVGGGLLRIDLRSADGHQIRVDPNNPSSDPKTLDVPVRAANHRVIAVADLRKRLAQQKPANPTMPDQTGSASFAVSVLNPPWRQRFEGTEDHAEQPGGSGAFVSVVLIGSRVLEASTQTAVASLLNLNQG